MVVASQGFGGNLIGQAAQPWNSFAPTIDETELRHRCGDATFRRADALQRAGHVRNATFQNGVLSGDVHGTWRRIDRVTLSEQGSRLSASCSCRGSQLCRHAVALLLRWLRDRSSFAVVQITSPSVEMLDDSTTGESALDELHSALEHETLTDLRQIARRRGLRINARNKAEFLAGLVPALANPESVATALAHLSTDERLTLDAAHLLGNRVPMTTDEVAACYQVLGGKGEFASFEALHERGLLILRRTFGFGDFGYQVPRVVTPHLAPIESLARPSTRRRGEDVRPKVSTDGAATMRPPQLSIAEFLQVIADDIGRDGARWREITPSHTILKGYVPPGWQIDPSQLTGLTDPAELLGVRRQAVRLIPTPPPMADDDLRRLATRTGQTLAATSFAVHLLVDLGIIVGASQPIVRAERLQSLLATASPALSAQLGQAWLRMADWTELGMLLSSQGPLQVRAFLSYYYGPLLQSETVVARRHIARLIGRMVPDRWFDFQSFLQTIYQISPRLLGQLPAKAGATGWWIARRDQNDLALDTSTPTDWIVLCGSLVAAILAGPLRWLGFVDVQFEKEIPVAFRVRPQAGVLVDRDVPETIEDQTKLIVRPDMTVLVPAGTSDVAAHSILARAGTIAEVSAAGLRYQLTAERVHALFDAGTTGPELIQFLADRADTPLAGSVRAIIDGWWANYGSIHLYDDLTLVELGDDFLLPELLATTTLRASLVHTFSPRLIAIDPAAANRIIAELTRLGHAPRVVDETP
ncbi:MAG TPA: helicase-associated domain-containing protein [Chloroflexota bacterium]|nr:helicase-associated domain-containing protein [Chloroflexota bacterium]